MAHELIDYEAARRRFPWMGLVDEEWGDVAVRYRDIMASAWKDRQTVEAIDAVRRTA